MANCKRVCYIHMGMGKTGSSALQYALTKNQDYLLKYGFLYPDISNNFKDVLSELPTSGNAFDLCLALKEKNGKQAVKFLRPFFDRPEHLVLSCEGFWHLRYSILEEFVNELRSVEYDIKCLIFIRPHAEWLLSHFIQSIKTGKINADNSLVEYVDEYLSKPNRWNWHMRVHKLEKIFGRNSLNVKWYPSVIQQGASGISNIVFDWLELKSPESESDTINQIINPSLSREALIVLRLISAEGFGSGSFVNEFLAIAQKKGLLNNKIKLGPELQERIEAATFESNAKLLKRYCPELSVQKELKKPVNLTYSDHIDKQITDQLIKIAADILPELNVQNLYDSVNATV